MKKCIIVGGGLAGLSTAIHLIQKNIQPVILESSPKLGGRASSFYDYDFSCDIDNGQHILMGCYNATFEVMQILNALDNLIYQNHLRIEYVDAAGTQIALDAKNKLYPLNILSGLLSYKAIAFKKRVSIVTFFINCVFLKGGVQPKGKTVREWLLLNGQDIEIQKALWDFLSIGALNTSPDKADAILFRTILIQMFLKGNFSTTIVLSRYDLSKTFCEPAEEHIKKHGGEIYRSERVKKIDVENNTVTKIYTENKVYTDFTQAVFALPPHALQKIEGIENILDPSLLDVTYSSILTFHLQLKDNKLTQPFYGLIDSPVHWVFNHKDYVTTVISDADNYMQKSESELLDMVCAELEKYLKISRQDIGHHKMVKEKRATVVPDETQLRKRPEMRTRVKNLFLAGDWVRTGFPATIEGAMFSGKNAVREIS